MQILGIDPDLHRTAFAVIDGERNVLKVGVSRVSHALKGAEAVIAQITACYPIYQNFRYNKQNQRIELFDTIVIEGQETYFGAGHAPPQGIVHLGQMTGVLLALGWRMTNRLHCPKPKSWKGQVPKDIHQKRIQSKVDCTQVQSYGNIADKDWIHIWDAIGLALYGLEKINGHT